MKIRMVLSLGLSALVFGGTMVGCTAGGGNGLAAASDRSTLLAERAAAENARKATKALAKRDGVAAIQFAEAAVALSPRTAAYRMLLGQSYLQGGRFVSAQQTFADVLTLSPGNGKAALNQALAQVATGDWNAARHTLDTNAAIISPSDFGLAIALAGDPARGVALLTQAARTPGADAKLRQNLALTFALAGHWNMARVVAAADMSPADVDRRIEEWAAFVQPQAASDQIASLLGVSVSADNGMPVALALNAPASVAPMVVGAAPVVTAPAAPVPVAPVAVAVAPSSAPMIVAVPAPLPAVAAVAAVPTMLAKVNFAPSREIVQPLPTPLIRAERIPAKVFARAAARSAVATKGHWYVQIGAYNNAGVAKNGWSEATRRFAALSGHVPEGVAFRSGKGSFYRVSVGGFTRGDADALCRRYRATGGDCFVRAGAGDQTAHWLRKPDARLASS
jgi:Flp pilus assembly protein TadD